VETVNQSDGRMDRHTEPHTHFIVPLLSSKAGRKTNTSSCNMLGGLFIFYTIKLFIQKWL